MTALLLAFLVGGATFLGLQTFAQAEVSIALAGAIFVAVLFEAIRDTWQGHRDRLVAHARLEQLAANDLERTARRSVTTR